MKRIIIPLALAIFGMASHLTGAQTLDDVLDQHYKAVGIDRIDKMNTFIITAKLSQMGMEVPMKTKFKYPDKFYIEMEVQGQKSVQAFDGKKGWMISPWTGPDPQVLEGVQLQMAMSQADIGGELHNYNRKGSSAQLAGKVITDGREAFRVKLITSDGNEKYYFIDATSYLGFKVQAKVEVMGQTVDLEQRMTEHKKIDGVTIATRIESDSPMGTAVVTIEEVVFNAEIEDSIFLQPGK